MTFFLEVIFGPEIWCHDWRSAWRQIWLSAHGDLRDRWNQPLRLPYFLISCNTSELLSLLLKLFWVELSDTCSLKVSFLIYFIFLPEGYSSFSNYYLNISLILLKQFSCTFFFIYVLMTQHIHMQLPIITFDFCSLGKPWVGEGNIKWENLTINIFWQCLINMAIIKCYITCQAFFIIK